MTAERTPTEGSGWFTSSYTGASGSCVEVRFIQGGTLVRDSKDGGAARPTLSIGPEGWRSFLDAITDPTHGRGGPSA